VHIELHRPVPARTPPPPLLHRRASWELIVGLAASNRHPCCTRWSRGRTKGRAGLRRRTGPGSRHHLRCRLLLAVVTVRNARSGQVVGHRPGAGALMIGSSSDKGSFRCERPAAGLPFVPVALVPRVFPCSIHRSALLPLSTIATMFGVFFVQAPACRRFEPLPDALWEFSLGVWLIVKGFSPPRSQLAMAAAST